MRYSTLAFAASTFTGFVAAQNSSQYNPPIECCKVEPSSVDQNDRQVWCRANENTCIELCGGRGQLASNGNKCDAQTLDFSCNCRNGTDVSSVMDQYQQTVPGQMCLVWYSNCIAASGTDATAQFECEQVRSNVCGNKTIEQAKDAGNAGSNSNSNSGSSSSSPTSTSGSPDATNTGGSATTSAAGEGAAAHLSFYGSSVLAGGLFALFGVFL